MLSSSHVTLTNTAMARRSSLQNHTLFDRLLEHQSRTTGRILKGHLEDQMDEIDSGHV